MLLAACVVFQDSFCKYMRSSVSPRPEVALASFTSCMLEVSQHREGFFLLVDSGGSPVAEHQLGITNSQACSLGPSFCRRKAWRPREVESSPRCPSSSGTEPGLTLRSSASYIFPRPARRISLPRRSSFVKPSAGKGDELRLPTFCSQVGSSLM